MTLRFVPYAECKRDRRKLKKLYKKAFPRDERAPFSVMRRLAKNRADFYGIFDGETFVGLVYNVRRGSLVYLFYLAVSEDCRGKGYGGEILARVRAQNENCTVILNIEEVTERAANFGERTRRLAFYERNGFRDTGIKLEEYGVVYQLLQSDECAVTAEDYLALMEDFFGPRIFRMFYLPHFARVEG